jgi:hypothetical protein
VDSGAAHRDGFAMHVCLFPVIAEIDADFFVIDRAAQRDDEADQFEKDEIRSTANNVDSRSTDARDRDVNWNGLERVHRFMHDRRAAVRTPCDAER